MNKPILEHNVIGLFIGNADGTISPMMLSVEQGQALNILLGGLTSSEQPLVKSKIKFELKK